MNSASLPIVIRNQIEENVMAINVSLVFATVLTILLTLNSLIEG